MASVIDDEFEKLVRQLGVVNDVEPGQMFGKACIKVRGKVFLSRQKECLAFKLTGDHHRAALALEGALPWNPSGRRPLKEWVAVPATGRQHFAAFARAACEYVATL